jgi:hypothetical protein
MPIRYAPIGEITPKNGLEYLAGQPKRPLVHKAILPFPAIYFNHALFIPLEP